MGGSSWHVPFEVPPPHGPQGLVTHNVDKVDALVRPGLAGYMTTLTSLF